MKIKSFRIQKYKNIEDSGKIDLLDDLTCIIGKNQAGKTALLRALHKFNPHEPDPYDLRREWPRGQRIAKDFNQIVCEVTFELSDEEKEDLEEISGESLESRLVLISKDYEGKFEVSLPNQPDLFPDTLHPNDIDKICNTLPNPTENMGKDFTSLAEKCVTEVRRYALEGRFDELSSLRNRHLETLQANRSPDNQEQRQHEDRFIREYESKLQEIETRLDNEQTIHAQAHGYLIDRIPTFIYMDDYRSFRGRSNLEELKRKRDNQNLTLSQEDETALMILNLSGLNLDELIKKGKSGDDSILHDRQLDLQDADRTLTNVVAGRWGQNAYRIQFRVDNQTFFTEIEEVNKDIGMIPLEEQSKGFQWFFSFDLHFMHDSEGTFEDCVLLLDEPGLHLHPGGQRDLLQRLDAYAEKNTLIYTTHLPFLVDLREPSRIKILTQTARGAVVSEDLGASQGEEKLTLQAAFGMKANQNYLVSKRNLVVEGVNDYWIIAELSNVLERSGKLGLPDDVLITAAGGASEVVHTATFLIGQGLEVVALFDSDDAGRRGEEKLRTQWITRYKDSTSTSLLIGDAIGAPSDFMIEDLFPEGYYLDKTRESHEQKLSAANQKGDAIKFSSSNTSSILSKISIACENVGINFNKGSVAKLIRKDLVNLTTADDLPDGTEEKAIKLFGAIRKGFGLS